MCIHTSTVEKNQFVNPDFNFMLKYADNIFSPEFLFMYQFWGVDTSNKVTVLFDEPNYKCVYIPMIR